MVVGYAGEALRYGGYDIDEGLEVDPFAGVGEGEPGGVCLNVDELTLCIGRSGGTSPKGEEPQSPPDVLKRGELVIIRRKERPEDERPEDR